MELTNDQMPTVSKVTPDDGIREWRKPINIDDSVGHLLGEIVMNA